jgi:ABC-2 type transport system ATP-binding protein
MIIIEDGRAVGGKPITIKDVERPRYLIEIATARADLGAFLKGAGIDVVEADEHHALITFTRNAGARAKLVRDLVNAGFELSSFGESTKALEDAYFTQVGKGAA